MQKLLEDAPAKEVKIFPKNFISTCEQRYNRVFSEPNDFEYFKGVKPEKIGQFNKAVFHFPGSLLDLKIENKRVLLHQNLRS